MIKSAQHEREAAVALDPIIDLLPDDIRNALERDLAGMPLDVALAFARPKMHVSVPPSISEDMEIEAADGAKLRLRLYGARADGGSRPILLHLHGGGFVGGCIELDDQRCVWLSEATGCIVASLDYRLAPEHRFPTAGEDAFDAWRFLKMEAPRIGGDPGQCAVSGSSAGGHLAVHVSQLARARGVAMPRFQLLTYPVIDPSMSSASYCAFARGPFLTRARMAWYWDQYVATSGSQPDEFWNPLLADARGLPPTLVLTAECDVLRDEGESFAAHLEAGGVAMRVRRFPGMIHGFVSMLPAHPQTRTALEESAAFISEQFRTSRQKFE